MTHANEMFAHRRCRLANGKELILDLALCSQQSSYKLAVQIGEARARTPESGPPPAVFRPFGIYNYANSTSISISARETKAIRAWRGRARPSLS